MAPLSLSDTASTWFTSLAPNSIFTWAQLKQKFLEYFYSGDTELNCHISPPLNKNIMRLPPITLGDLEITGISALI
jgi:hypothetical protein